MAQPARRVVAPPEQPPVDTTAAIDRAYHYHRALRRIRVLRRRDRAHARLRFLLVFLVLLGLALFLMLTIWREVQNVFGL